MATLAEVLERKERELQRLQTEIDALRLAARLVREAENETPVEVGRAAEAKAGAETAVRQFP